MPDDCPVVTKAVVPAPSVADEVYKASFMVSAPFVRLWPSTKSSCLNELQMAEVIAMVKAPL